MSQLNISLYNKSLKLIRERNISQAIKLLNDCCYIDDSSIDALNLLGLCFYCRCSFDKAKYLWNKSSKKNTTSLYKRVERRRIYRWT